MPSATRHWSTDEWETHIHALLALRYGPSGYQRIPSRNKGDAGIEGFSTDGTAYQCYAAQSWASTDELLTKQKRKLTADIGKFMRNQAKLSALFGTVKISAWLLVVPEHHSRQLIEHANSKTQEVLGAQLAYSTASFRIGVITDQAFPVELQQLLNPRAVHAALGDPAITSADVEAFANGLETSSLLSTMSHKLSKLPILSDTARRQALLKELIHKYLTGQSYLQRLHQHYPDAHQRLVALKSRTEATLAARSAMSNSPLNDRLDDLQESLSQQMAAELQVVSPYAADLALEAIADWLMRCPLDFWPQAAI